MNAFQDNKSSTGNEKSTPDLNPPPYSEASQNPPPPFQQNHPTPAGYRPPIFPPLFGVYTSGYRHLSLALHKDSRPFLSLETHSGFSGKPSMILSNGTSTLATADFHSLSSKTDLSVGTFNCVMQSDGMFTANYPFEYIHDDGSREVFAWKRSHGAEVQSLRGAYHGYKLVRVKNGQVVAAWTKPGGPSVDKVGKIALMERGLGERWEVTAVMGALALLEKERQKRNNGVSAGTAVAFST
ncbi:hypothetical protein CJF30_00000948 [Rutstroemia sp. NJR-2017a BBW]|nr:hypothetical protein CJF30_00000948 [Rutstroemia sp. NJR-2017a BBW]